MGSNLCHEAYDPCVAPGYTAECVCERDERSLIRGIYEEINRIYNTHRGELADLVRKYRKPMCMFQKTIIDEIGNIVKCFYEDVEEEFLKRNCPSHIICNEAYIAKLYRYNDHTFRNPDMLIVKGHSVTLIVERKRYGRQSHQRFREQLLSIYNNLPEDLRNPCTFIVYAPKGGSTLPMGFRPHRRFRLLVYIRQERRRQLNLFDVPVFVYLPGLLSYSR